MGRRQAEEELLDGRSLLNGDRLSGELARPVRIIGAARREEHALVHGPGLLEPQVRSGSLFGIGQADQVQPARVEVGPRAVPGSQPDLDLDPRVPGEGPHQLDVEARGPAIRVEVVKGREVSVAPVHEARLRGRRVGPSRNREPRERGRQRYRRECPSHQGPNAAPRLHRCGD